MSEDRRGEKSRREQGRKKGSKRPGDEGRGKSECVSE